MFHKNFHELSLLFLTFCYSYFSKYCIIHFYHILCKKVNILNCHNPKLKRKYQQIRDQKIRERVVALGVEIQDSDSREILLEKEKQYNLDRQKIELSLESFYRSANSLVFQLNKRYITRQMSIFRCIDRRFESGEIFIRWDESSDEDWLILIYIKDNNNWEKDKSRMKIKEVIKTTCNKNYEALKTWKETNPDYMENENKKDSFVNIISQLGKPIENIDNKVIKNICKETYVND